MTPQQAIDECLERIDHTRALLESQLTELHGIIRRAQTPCDSSQNCDLGGLSGHMLGMAVVAMRLEGATSDNMRTLLNMTLEP